MKPTNLLLSSSLAAIALIGCGSDDTTETSTASSTSATASSSSQGGAAASTSSGQGGAAASTSTGQGGAAASTSTGQGGAGASTSTGQGGAAASTSSTGGGDPMLNGCTLATAKDLTVQMKSVKITDISKWTFGHQACIIVMPGTQIVWDGDFATHPLAGGESGKGDLASPISKAAVNGGSATVIIPPDQPGAAFPYFCAKHPSMQGVIYTAAK